MVARHDARVQRVMTDYGPRHATAARDRHLAAHAPPAAAHQPALPGLEPGAGVAG